jgi:hypothetical protein
MVELWRLVFFPVWRLTFGVRKTAEFARQRHTGTLTEPGTRRNQPHCGAPYLNNSPPSAVCSPDAKPQEILGNPCRILKHSRLADQTSKP